MNPLSGAFAKWPWKRRPILGQEGLMRAEVRAPDSQRTGSLRFKLEGIKMWRQVLWSGGSWLHRWLWASGSKFPWWTRSNTMLPSVLFSFTRFQTLKEDYLRILALSFPYNGVKSTVLWQVTELKEKGYHFGAGGSRRHHEGTAISSCSTVCVEGPSILELRVLGFHFHWGGEQVLKKYMCVHTIDTFHLFKKGSWMDGGKGKINA